MTDSKPKIPDWRLYDTKKLCHNGAGIYIMDSWEFWPDLQASYKCEVEYAIVLWTEHGYEIPKQWIKFKEKRYNKSRTEVRLERCKQ